VDQVDEIEVQLSDGRTKKARLVGSDSQVDLAALKIDEPGVKRLKLGDSDAVQAGDMVLAIGNPFGFEETVTEGIISSKGRPNRVGGCGDFLQTDAAVNPGKKGDVIRKFNGRDVKNFPELRSLVAQAELNKKIEVEVLRDGKPLKVSAELREQPPDSQTARAIPQPGQPNPSNPLPQPNAPDT